MREPTPDECSANTEIEPKAWACWYPQMGGYVGKAVAQLDGDCWDVYVWHDGEFPFSEDEPRLNEPQHVRVIHHCEPAQFIAFGQLLESLE